MAIKKLKITPGVNRENTRYTSEGGWYESDKIRFRQGYPEKIGGWLRISGNTFIGVCRSLFKWSRNDGTRILGVGTDSKYYAELGGVYFDITPLRASSVAGGATFSAVTGSDILTITDTAHGAFQHDYVTFSSAVTLNGAITATVLNQNYKIETVVDVNNYTILAVDPSGVTVLATGADTGNGGSSTIAAYEIHTGAASALAFSGWGGGTWSEESTGWGTSGTTAPTTNFRIWNNSNFGEDLIAGIPNGPLYLWEGNTAQRMTPISVAVGATNTPIVHNLLLISDTSRFIFVFGCNPIGSGIKDPMLIRWSSQEDFTQWNPLATNSAGSLRLSRGSKIVAVLQSRQEVLVWTDIALYSLQYLGGSSGWGAQIVGENISTASQNAVAYANGTAYWMGFDKFYIYNGQTKALTCDLRKYLFGDFNIDQYDQVFSGTNESFHEIWWFYPAKFSLMTDRYIIYNYLEQVWYYGSLERSAWLDDGNAGNPVSATYINNLVLHEIGVDDKSTETTVPITSFITSSQFDIDDGDRFAFVSKVIPDISFDGSTAAAPSVDMSLLPLHDSGSGYNNPLSVGGDSVLPVIRTATAPVEVYTKQINLRVRGRQMSIKIESNDLGVQWQLGATRINMRPDGRR